MLSTKERKSVFTMGIHWNQYKMCIRDSKYIGFPNAAVDRIVPLQHHEDPLFVQVEPFKEWVIDDSQRKNKEIQLNGVLYVDDLEPYIERKLFSVSTGHATVAYTGALLGLSLIHI